MAGHLAQVMDTPLLAQTRGIIKLINPSQATGKDIRLCLGELESLHQLPDGEVVLCSEARWLALEIAHDEFQRTSRFVLGRRSWGTDGGDCGGF